MVGLNSSFALRDLGKDPKRLSPPPLPTHPPPDLSASNLDDFSFQFNDCFPDFDSIDDWIIEPDSAFPPMEELQLASSEQTQPALGLKDTMLDVPDPDLGNSRVEGHESKPQYSDASDLVRTELQIPEVKCETADVDEQQPNGCDSTELPIEISGKFGASGISIEEEMRKNISIAEEIGKVSLVGTSDAIPPNSERDGIDDVSGEVKSKEDMNLDSRVTAVEDHGERGATVSESDEVSESSDSEDSSSSSSEEEMDNGDDDDDDDDDDSDDSDHHGMVADTKMDADREIEEGEIRDFDQEDTSIISEDEEGGALKGPIKSKNEIEKLPPVPPVCAVLQPHHQMLPVGVVLSIIGTKVIVEGLEKHNPLNEGSVLWITSTGLPLGLVDEIFGPVKNPYYVVRFNSEEQIPAGIGAGTAISFVAEFANHVLNDRDLYKKGYDASGENDEEVSDGGEFSDDEKEADYRRSLRMTKRGKNRSGNQEFEGQKKAQFKGQVHKNVRPTNSPTIPVARPPVRGSSMLFVPGQLQWPPVLGPSGCGSCGCSLGSGHEGTGRHTSVSQSSYTSQAKGLGGPPQPNVPQANAVWANGIPTQQQHMGMLNCFQMNGMPHLPSMGGSTGLTGNHQFDCSHVPLAAMPSPCGQLGSLPMNLPGSNVLAANQPFDASQVPLPGIPSPCGHGHLGSVPMNLPVSTGFAGNQPFDASQLPLPAIPSPCGHGQLGSMPMNLPSSHGLIGNQPFDPSQVPSPAMPLPFGQLGVMPMNLPGFVGNGSFNQVPFGMCIQGQQGHHMQIAMTGEGAAAFQMQDLPCPSVPSQGGFSAPQKFNPGVAINRGRKPFPRGGRGNSSGRRGWRPTGQ